MQENGGRKTNYVIQGTVATLQSGRAETWKQSCRNRRIGLDGDTLMVRGAAPATDRHL